ncbi:hypothetical protein BJV77DRAFT_191444 [Russula vinacea]|nr:hypothetical protein BJV77DRAFT_191444 [Russula vinacea]
MRLELGRTLTHHWKVAFMLLLLFFSSQVHGAFSTAAHIRTIIQWQTGPPVSAETTRTPSILLHSIVDVLEEASYGPCYPHLFYSQTGLRPKQDSSICRKWGMATVWIDLPPRSLQVFPYERSSDGRRNTVL